MEVILVPDNEDGLILASKDGTNGCGHPAGLRNSLRAASWDVYRGVQSQ